MIAQLLDTFQTFFLDEKIAVACGLVYVILAARNNPASWVFGIVGSAFWAYGTYVHYNLFFDSILNVFYVVMGFLGLYSWIYGREGGKKPIVEMPINSHLTLIAIGVIISIVLAYLVIAFEILPLDYPYLDSFTTVFSLIATYILVQRARSNWIYFIIVDAVYVYLYIEKEAYLYAILFVLYTIIAIIGYYNWGRVKQGEELH